VEEDSGESVKSEDREQFNSFQENCDEVPAIMINFSSQIF
jgi:hypothetical protein